MLVERCISSEGECEKLREKVTEHRRKLDDAQAALQELGRENQSLQVGWGSGVDVKLSLAAWQGGAGQLNSSAATVSLLSVV